MKLVSVFMIMVMMNCQVNPIREGRKYIQSLSQDNFDNATDKGYGKRSLVLVYSSKQKESQDFLSTYQKLAYDNREGNVKFTEIDCIKENDLCRLLRIKVYPSLFLLDNNRMFLYKDIYAEEQINMFIRENWDKSTSMELPTQPPSLYEELVSSLNEMKRTINNVLENGNSFNRFVMITMLGLFTIISIMTLGLLVLSCTGLGKKLIKKKNY